MKGNAVRGNFPEKRLLAEIGKCFLDILVHEFAGTVFRRQERKDGTAEISIGDIGIGILRMVILKITLSGSPFIILTDRAAAAKA